MSDQKWLVSVWLVILIAAVCWAQKPDLLLQSNHTGGIQSVAFSPDSKLIASVGDDETVKLWDVETGNQIRAIAATAGNDLSSSVAFSPNGKHLAVGGS